MSGKKNGLGPGVIEIDGEKYHSDTFEYEGEQITVRELSVDEGDDIGEAATGKDGLVNNRLNTRLLLAKSIVSPATSVEQVGHFGSRKYLLVLRAFNRLNSLPEANPTLPAGPTELESPAGGELLPTT